MNITRGDLTEHILIHRKVRLSRTASRCIVFSRQGGEIKIAENATALAATGRFEDQIWRNRAVENDIFSHMNGIFFEEENIKLQSSKAEVIPLWLLRSVILRPNGCQGVSRRLNTAGVRPPTH